MKKKIISVLVFGLMVLGGGNLFIKTVFASSANITQLNFTSSPQSIDSNSISAALTTQTQNITGTLEQTDETNYLDLTSTSTTGEFSSNATTWNSVNKLTMSTVSANRNFYYRDSTPGIYTITVSVEGKTWTPATQSITIIDNTVHVDATDPVITLIGIGTVNLNVGYPYTDAGATALDNGVDLTTSIIKGGTYKDTSIAGTYTITYNVSDNAGNPALQVVRTIIVSAITSTPPLDSTPPAILDPLTINLKVYSGNTILFDGPETVIACAQSPAVGAPITVNGKCAIEQTNLSNTWSWYDSNFKKDSLLPKTLGNLDELGGSSSDDVNYIYWGWFSNLEYGSVSLNNHLLSNREELLLTYNSYPLRILSSKNSGTVSDTIMFTAEGESTYDSNPPYGMIWTPLEGTTVTLGTQSCVTTTDGTCSIILDNAGSLNAFGSKTLYVPSASISVEVANSVGGGGSSVQIPSKTFSISSALSFLSKNKDSASIPLHDWMAIAAGAGNDANLKSDLATYIRSNPVNSSIVTENDRRAMALMSLGINPYNGTEINYIQKILDSFNGTQFIDDSSSDFNDDIFALIVLKNAGYSGSDEIIKNDINYIISKQSNGSWGSVDMTAAAIQALSPFSSASGVSGALSRAVSYLQNAQGNGGGWGNISSSSWTTQVLGATWSKNGGKTAADYFAEQQDADGAVLSSTETFENRIWATAYAVPAMTSKPWGDIMQTFEKPIDIPVETKSSTEIPTPIAQPTLLATTTPLQNLDVVKKIDDKKTIEVTKVKSIKKPDLFKKTLQFTATDPKPLLSSSVNNNLGASARNASSNNLSIKGISQAVTHSVINLLTYIGKGFMDLITFIQNLI